MFDLHFIIATDINKNINNNNAKILSIFTELFVNKQSPDWVDSENEISKFFKNTIGRMWLQYMVMNLNNLVRFKKTKCSWV